MNSSRQLALSFTAIGLTSLALGSACSGGDDPANTGGAGSGIGGANPNAGGSNSGGANTNSGGSNPNSGGSTAGGTTGMGGSGQGGGPGIGGSTSGGAPGDGGSSAGGSMSGGAPGVGGGGGEPTDCTITISKSEAAPGMQSVGVIEFGSDLAGMDSATIEFGKTTAYGMTAPVDMTEANLKTFLLGMTFSSEYHYKINVSAGGQTCSSEDQTITTGPMPNGTGVNITMGQASGTAMEDGFIVSALYNGGTPFITNMQGELVWVRSSMLGDAAQTRLSHDSKFLYARNGNPSGTSGLGGGGQMVKIAIDGSGEELINQPGSHHDFTVMPNGDIVYIARSTVTTNCDAIMLRPIDGSADRSIYDVADAFPTALTGGGSGDDCHTNTIRYNAFDDSLTAGALRLSGMLNISSDGSTLNWVVGTADATLDMGGLSWEVQHGTHMLDANTLLFFNNNGTTPQNGDNASLALIMNLDFGGGTAALDTWMYDSNKATFSQGDVQRLDNGNTLVTYSNDSEIHEVDAAGSLVRAIQVNSAVGYATHRMSLYGPTPR